MYIFFVIPLVYLALIGPCTAWLLNRQGILYEGFWSAFSSPIWALVEICKIISNKFSVRKGWAKFFRVLSRHPGEIYKGKYIKDTWNEGSIIYVEGLVDTELITSKIDVKYYYKDRQRPATSTIRWDEWCTKYRKSKIEVLTDDEAKIFSIK